MAFRLNRPFGIGKYLKLRVNKKSLGLQVGGKYLKGTINTKGQVTGSVGGAGTGMYIQKTKNLKNNKKCKSFTASGNQCSRNATDYLDYCKQHSNKPSITVENKVEEENIYKVDKKFPLEITNLLSNEALSMMPKNKEIDRLHNLFHSTSNEHEKLHTEKSIINFQKALIIFSNFVIQDFAINIKAMKISEFGNLNNFSLEKYNKVGGAFITNIANVVNTIALIICPVKFAPPHTRNVLGGDFPFDYSIYDYIDIDQKITEKQFIDSIKYLIDNKDYWNNKNGYEENFESKSLDTTHRKFFGDSQTLILPNTVSGLFDIPNDTLRYAKIFNLDKLVSILLKGFGAGKFDEIKKSNSAKLMNQSILKDDFDIFNELENQFYGKKGEVLGTYKSDVTVEE